MNLLLAIIGHLIGDYILQTDWMALNKKKHTWPCFIHCLLWSLSVTLISGASLLAFTLLFITHFIQDRTNIIIWWMKLKWKDQSKFMECDTLLIKHDYEPSIKPGLGPWSIIIVDNVWHIIFITLIWRFLT